MRRTLIRAIVASVLPILISVPALAAERPDFEFDGRQWSLGFQARQGPTRIEEFVLEGESVCCWSELVTWQYFAGWQGRESATEIMRQLRHRRMILNPTLEWEILARGFDSVLYTWGIETDCMVGDYFELTRILKTREGLHIFRYAALDREAFSENLDSWVESFREIEISE